MELPDDPWTLFAAWWREADASEPRVPDAMQLATVGEGGRPSIRTVLVKGSGPESGLVFFTNYESRKGAEILANPDVAGCLHWKSLERQIVVEGRAEPIAAEESDVYHALRPRGSQVGAWASDQSRPLRDPDALRERVALLEGRYGGGQVPRPPHWGGFRIRVRRFEFWQGRPDRLHERAEYVDVGGGWARSWLYP